MLSLNEAKAILDKCCRLECRDHAFGDMEVSWYRKEHIIPSDRDGCGWIIKEHPNGNQYGSVADGYIGGGSDGIDVYHGDKDDPNEDEGEYRTDFPGRELLECGELLGVGRNDSTGPDEFQAGVCLPGLTVEAVRKELTG